MLINITHDINYQYQYSSKRKTFAMWLAEKGIIPDQEKWQHNPCLQDEYGWSVAMILAYKRIIPPREWMHDYDIKNNFNKSINDYLRDNYLPVPKYWNDNDMNIFDQACFGIIPDIQGYQPDKQDKNGFTVAMILAINNINIPKEWYHQANIQNNEGYTIAMIQAKNGKIPDKQWQHKPELQNHYGYTVAMFLAEKKIIPPKQWQHNSYIKNIYDETVEDLLIDNDLQVPDVWKCK